MATEPIHILLIEDEEADARAIAEGLADVREEAVRLSVVQTLAEGIELIDRPEVDVVLLDLTLPDSDREKTLSMLQSQTMAVPVIILTGLEDEDTAARALQLGAQDYLVKGEVSGPAILRAARHAIQRRHALEELRALSLTDDLTGLYNRRGFMALARQQAALAGRTGSSVTVVFMDLDGLKAVNDSFGHREGDRYLVDAAVLLRETCRVSDVVARIGGDEFAVITTSDEDDAGGSLPQRLRAGARELNDAPGRLYPFGISVGTARLDPEHPKPLPELLDEADDRMYDDKRRGRGQTTNGGPEA